MNFLLRSILLVLLPVWLMAQDHLLISEIVVTPTVGEYIEIYNPTNAVIDLSQYYVTDATNSSNGDYYYNIVTGANSGGDAISDYHVHFPSGASIAPGSYQTVAINGTEFISTYGQSPTYELESAEAGVPDMIIAFGSVAGAGITNSGEVVIVYRWDGVSDLVSDVDYVVWGDKAEAVDKTGISIDGPDAGSDLSTYLDDTAISSQVSASAGTPHVDGESIQRLSDIETGETASGGNGLTGHDETSETLSATFTVAAATPNTGPPASGSPVIANISRSPVNPQSSDLVTISADVTDDVLLVSVQLFYTIDGGALDSADMSNTGGDTYEAAINPQPENTVVNYYIKAQDNDDLVTISPTNSYTVIAPPQLVAIADIQANPSAFTVVTVEGIVTLGAGRTTMDWTTAYIQDSSGRGINIFMPNVVDPLLVRGNEVRITGTVDDFNGITEIVDYSIELISTGNVIPDPLALSTSGAGNLNLEGTYIETTGTITDIFPVGGGTNITIDDGSGGVTVRVWDATGINISGFSLNDLLTSRGVMGVFNSASQILPGYQDELTLAGQNPGDGSGSATISPDSVNISQAVEANITITGTAAEILETISIDIPFDWGWSGSPGSVQLSGNGFLGAAFSVSGNTVTISNAAVTESDQGLAVISDLTAPDTDLTSTFLIKTAVAGGTLLPIASSPTIVVGAGGPAATPIADIQANPSAFTVVTVEGIVTLGAGRTTMDWTTAYIQDNSGRGINIFKPSVVDPLLVRGNEVRITGTVDDFNGITEIVDYSIELISTGNVIPDPLALSTSGAGNLSLEGTYIETTGTITDIFPVGGGTNIAVDDGSGEVSVRVWDATGINISGFSLNDLLTARGVMGVFNSASQILTGYQDELTLAGQNPGDGSGTAVISPDSVNASQAVEANITITGIATEILESISIDIPFDWGWSGSPGSVQLSGNGFFGATFSISGNTVTITNAAVTESDQGVAVISDLTAPNTDLTSTFIIKTAVAGGTLLPIGSSPTIVVGAGGPAVTPIASIQNNPSGFNNVTIQGVVTVAAGVNITSRTEAYVQDNSGRGINVFSFDLPSDPPNNLLQRRNLVRISGSVDEFEGITEIVDFTVEVLAVDQPLPDTLRLSTSDAGNLVLEGTYVQVTGEVQDIAGGLGGGSNITVDDGSGELTVRVWDISGVNIGFVSVGDTLIATGILDIFNNAAQLVASYQDELVLQGKGNGEGIVSLNINTIKADTLISVTAMLKGSESNNVLNSVQIFVPFNWVWTGDANDVSLSGNGFAGAQVEVTLDFDAHRIDINNASLTAVDSGTVVIKNLATPDDSVFSYFWIKTAVAGGNPAFIIKSPQVVVGSNPIHLIRDVQTNPGQFTENVTLTGIVTVAGGIIRDTPTSAYFQDNSGRGIQIFDFDNPTDPPNDLIQRGYKLRINGLISEFSETTQIMPSSITHLDTGIVFPEPAPVVLTTEEAFHPRWDGTLLQVRGLVTEKFSTSPAADPTPDFNVEVNDGSGGIFLRVWGTTGIDLSEINVNNAIIANGIGSVFIDNENVRNYQLLPAYQEHLEIDPNAQPTLESVSLTVPPNPFAPDIGEKIEIKYDAGFVLNRITIRIFDLGGRLITTLLDEEARLIRNTLQWDGRDRLRDMVPLGTYICHLEVVEPVSGKRKSKLAPIVVGTVLSR